MEAGKSPDGPKSMANKKIKPGKVAGIQRVIPQIITFLTGKPRYLPEIIWSNKSFVHNIFRFYEMIFWAERAIRAQITTSFDGRKAVSQAYTFEAACALAENSIRELFRFRIPIKIWIPKLSNPNGLPNPFASYMFAIAFDATANVKESAGGNPHTYTHTCTGSNLILVVGAICSGIGIPSSATYNSVSMTSQALVGGGAPFGRTLTLINPATGSHTVSVEQGGTSGSHGFVSISSSFTGVDQSNPIDGTDTSGSTLSTNPVTSRNNSWVIDMIAVANSFASGAPGSGQTLIGALQASPSSIVIVGGSSYKVTTSQGTIAMSWTGTLGGTAKAMAVGIAVVAPQNYTKTLTETLHDADTLSKQTSVVLIETIYSVISLVKRVSKVFGETLHGTGTLIKQASKALIETLHNTDTLIRQTAKVLINQIINIATFSTQAVLYRTLIGLLHNTDTLVKNLAKTFSEINYYADSLAKQAIKILSETLINIASLSRQMIKLLNEEVINLDILLLSPIKLLSETIHVADNFVKQAAKTLKETIVNIASVGTISNFFRTMDEAIINSDVVAFITIKFKTLADSMHGIDTLIRQTTIVVTEIIHGIDSLTRQVLITLTESGHYISSLIRHDLKVLKETGHYTDILILKILSKTFSETLIFSASVSKKLTRVFLEEISILAILVVRLPESLKKIFLRLVHPKGQINLKQ